VQKLRETSEAIATGKIKRVPTPQYLSAMSRRKGGFPWRLVMPNRRRPRIRQTKRKP
jgi:hypothetical protein